MQKLPIGIQNFHKLRTNNYLYVDKTQLLAQLMEGGKYYFLSRPRRFGKSLLLSTISELFKGNQTLFSKLWIEDKWDWTKTHPIVELRFNEAAYKDIGLKADLNRRLAEQATVYDISLEEEQYVLRFRELIIKLAEKHGKVVILVYEYDKPIIDFLHDIPQAEEHREILKNLYSVIKPLDQYIELFFLTGVSKFSRVSIFSELNNLFDLTIYSDTATLLGYTQEELEYYFQDSIVSLAPKFGGKEALLAKIKDWYNGYSWDGEQRVYNPFSILNFFKKNAFQNFWFETGTPTFLIKLLRQNQVYDMDKIQTTSASFSSYELHHISPISLLFQTGYLTIKQDLGLDLYELGYPNQEVKASMLQYLIADYTHGEQGVAAAPALLMAHALLKGELDTMKLQINTLLGSIPYDLYQDNEAYYHTIMHLAFSLIGVHIQSEIHVAKGRLDSIIETDQAIYIFEFKASKQAKNDAKTALNQIKETNYAQAYLGQKKPVFGIGVSFDIKEREVSSWSVEQL